MHLSILQLNINSDNFWNQLTTYLTTHDFDILHLQEITGKDTISGNIDSKRDCFEALQKLLGEKYNGALTIAERFTSSPSAYLGNATFYKKQFTLIEKNILPINQQAEPFSSTAQSFEKEARSLLYLTLEIEGRTISFLNTHLAWAKTPKEEPHQTEQAAILIDYLKTVPSPFVLSGDFNLDPQQPTVQNINVLARNLTSEYHITNTLNPRTHRAQMLFPPGVAVDYIYVSRDISVKTFDVVEEDLSDHLGLTAELEI